MKDADLDGALAIAGLGDAIDRKVKTYSQGMKQRLGFARLLLGRPELLVLDEPTNGLDPGEIREIRELIGRLSTHGATVLLSSHHLSEVEQVCSHVLVMNHGRLVADGTVSELIGSAGSVYVEVDDRERALALLSNLASVAKVQIQGDGLVVEMRDGQRSDHRRRRSSAPGLRLETIMPTQRLEDAFLDLLAGAAASSGPPTRRSRRDRVDPHRVHQGRAAHPHAGHRAVAGRPADADRGRDQVARQSPDRSPTMPRGCSGSRSRAACSFRPRC